MNGDLNYIGRIRQELSDDETVAFISGYFNILHPGHLRLIQYAAAQADFLIVAVLSDKMVPDATVRDKERLEAVSVIKGVGQAFILDCDLRDCLLALKPDVIVKGWEHREEQNIEQDIVQEYGGELIFSSGETKFSSFDLIAREFNHINYSNIEKPANFPQRHDFTLKKLKSHLRKFSKLKLCVIGDVIVDEYRQCDAIGMSREDPTIVVRPIQSNCFLGGAGIVSAHAASLGASVHFLSVVGKDNFADFAAEKLKEFKIDAFVLQDSQRPTTHKMRYRAEGKTLLRVNNFTDRPIGEKFQEQILAEFLRIVNDLDLLVFSDFNYGVLPQSLVDQLCEVAAQNNVMIVADSQSSSQTGDISRFKNVKLVSPTEYEARLALQNQNDGLVTLAEKLSRKVNADYVFLTLGSEGTLVHSCEPPPNSKSTWQTDRLPAFNSSPRDTAGAGDAMLVVSSMALAAKATIWESSYLGAIAAACQVGRVGNIPLTVPELITELDL